MTALAATPAQFSRFVRLPGAVPYIMTGLRLAAPASVIAAIVAEYFGGLQNGLGSRITSAAANTAYARAWAFVVASIVLGLLFYLAGLLAERLVTRGPRPGENHEMHGSARASPPRRRCWPWASRPARPHPQAPSGGGAAPSSAAGALTPGQAAAAVGDPGPVRRLLRRRRPGLLQEARASTCRSSRAAWTSSRRPCSPRARPTTRSPGCPRRSPRREQGAGITDVAQVFQRSGTYQVSFKDKGITAPADLRGQEGRQLGLRQRVRAVRRA